MAASTPETAKLPAAEKHMGVRSLGDPGLNGALVSRSEATLVCSGMGIISAEAMRVPLAVAGKTSAL
jgi:hypothetical protein